MMESRRQAGPIHIYYITFEMVLTVGSDLVMIMKSKSGGEEAALIELVRSL